MLIGAGRGGTSLLASMLDYHPSISVGFERFAFDFLLGEKLAKEVHGDIEGRLSAFDEACKQEAVKGESYWGNKITTEQIMALVNCDGASWDSVPERFVSEVVRNQRVVFIVRDGRYCVQSKMERAGLSYEEALARWKDSVWLLNSFKEAGVKIHECRYEDLLKSPDLVLTGICRFLGQSFDPAMLKGTANPMMPEIYAGKELRPIQELTDTQRSWTNDMLTELKQLKYIDEDQHPEI